MFQIIPVKPLPLDVINFENDYHILKSRSVVNLVETEPLISHWPRGLWRRSAAARLLRSWVRILLGAWKFVCCECCVLLGRGLCDELITRPEESYRLWCVVVCDVETSRMRRPWPALGRSATAKKKPLTAVQRVFGKHFTWSGWARVDLLLGVWKFCGAYWVH